MWMDVLMFYNDDVLVCCLNVSWNGLKKMEYATLGTYSS